MNAIIKNDKENPVALTELTLKRHDIQELVEENTVSTQAFALWIRKLLQNWRQGTVGVKDRSEVNLTGKKPWKQKGTGRARAGTARSPLWVGGGVTHGPQPRTRQLKINKKHKTRVLQSLVWRFVDNQAIHVLPDMFIQDTDRPRTVTAFNVLKKYNLEHKKIVLFLPFFDASSYASFVNLPNIHIVHFDSANAFDLANAQHWIFFQKDFQNFKDMVAQWN